MTDKLGEAFRQAAIEGFKEGILHPERHRLFYLGMILGLDRHGNPEFRDCNEQEQFNRIVEAIRRLRKDGE